MDILYSENDFYTIIFILKFFFIEDNNIELFDIISWENKFFDLFYNSDNLNENYQWDIYIDKNTKVEFCKFESLNELIKYLENIPCE
jgi:hypothetical protein